MLAADAILVLHTLFVAFVVLGLVCIVVGGILGWRWVRNRWFRYAHLAAIGVVVLQSWLGALLYYRAPDWVFVVVYTVFGALVLATWFAVRPRPAGHE